MFCFVIVLSVCELLLICYFVFLFHSNGFNEIKHDSFVPATLIDCELFFIKTSITFVIVRCNKILIVHVYVQPHFLTDILLNLFKLRVLLGV